VRFFHLFCFLAYFFLYFSCFHPLFIPSLASVSHTLSLFVDVSLVCSFSFHLSLCFFVTPSFEFWHHHFTTSFLSFPPNSSSLWGCSIVGHKNRPTFLYRLNTQTRLPSHRYALELRIQCYHGYVNA
jgi:hypothetical protein